MTIINSLRPALSLCYKEVRAVALGVAFVQDFFVYFFIFLFFCCARG